MGCTACYREKRIAVGCIRVPEHDHVTLSVKHEGMRGPLELTGIVMLATCYR